MNKTEQIPNGWKECELKELLIIVENGSRPTGGVDFESGEIPSLGGENIILEGGIKYYPVKKIPRKFFNQMKRGILRDKDVLINKDGANTGKTGLYNNYYKEAAINEHLFILRGNSNKITQEYLYYTLLSTDGIRQITDRITGSAQPGLNSKFSRKFLIKIPVSTMEQQKITHILLTVDNTIDKTKDLIEKSKNIKQGLMQDLIEKGLNYKKRKEKLGKLLTKIKRGPSLSTNLQGRGLIYLTSENIDENNRLIWNEIKYLDKFHNTKSCILEHGDVIINCVNSEDRIGKTAYYDLRTDNVIIGFNNFALSFNTSIDSKYMYYHLSDAYFQIKIKELIKPAVNQVSFSGSDLASIEVTIPEDINDQRKIGSILEQMDKQVICEQTYLSKLTKIRMGLMQDLLVGKIRVIDMTKESS